MTQFLDRRLNPKGKSLANRQRFLRRARTQIRDAVQKSLKDSGVADIGKERKIKISTKGTQRAAFPSRPQIRRRTRFRAARQQGILARRRDQETARRRRAAAASRRADSGDGEDDFEFTMTAGRDSRHLLRRSRTAQSRAHHAEGNPVQDLEARRHHHRRLAHPDQSLRTMRNSFGRRLALKRPRRERHHSRSRTSSTRSKREASRPPRTPREDRGAQGKIAKAHAKRKWVGFIDPVDVRYNSFTEQPVPTSQAVMFCLMDVSGSMGEREKDLAKRFYMLLHLFLKRRYERVDIVFIRHTHDAQEVDEQEFFYSRAVGRHHRVDRARQDAGDPARSATPPPTGTSMRRRPPTAIRNRGDARRCVEMLNDDIMPLCQYYAYIEILDEREMEVFACGGFRRRTVARLSHRGRSLAQFRHQAHLQARRHLPGLPRTVQEDGERGVMLRGSPSGVILRGAPRARRGAHLRMTRCEKRHPEVRAGAQRRRATKDDDAGSAGYGLMGGWTYMLRCADRSYYVGSTSQEALSIRVGEHNNAKFRGYTSSRRPVTLVWFEWFGDIRDAHEMEQRLKGWNRAKKKALISGDAEKLKLLAKRRAGSPRKASGPARRSAAQISHSNTARHPEARAQRATKDD